MVEAFQEPFLNRLVATLKKEMKKLSPADAVGSISIAKLGAEEGFSAPSPGSGDGNGDEAAAARKSEKVCLTASYLLPLTWPMLPSRCIIDRCCCASAFRLSQQAAEPVLCSLNLAKVHWKPYLLPLLLHQHELLSNNLLSIR